MADIADARDYEMLGYCQWMDTAGMQANVDALDK
jgi:hypothetical protein